MIWPFNKPGISATRVQPPMSNPRFKHDGVVYRYAPQTDITAYEVALIFPTGTQSSGPVNLYGYFEDNNLLRHFQKEE